MTTIKHSADHRGASTNHPWMYILVVPWVMMIVAGVQSVGLGDSPPSNHAKMLKRPRAKGCVDPNTAPWWELAVLPEMGVQTAKAVEAYRRSRMDENDHSGSVTRMFKHPNDLQCIRGIGPKTIARLAPELCFD